MPITTTSILGLHSMRVKCRNASRPCSAAAESVRLQHSANAAQIATGIFRWLCPEIQYLAMQLQVAMATGRTLVISPEWTSVYIPDGCVWPPNKEQKENPTTKRGSNNSWDCLYQPVSHCHAPRSIQDDAVNNRPQNNSQQDPETTRSSLGLGAGLVEPQSTYFDTHYNSESQRVLEAPSRPLPVKDPWKPDLDRIPGWERTYGRFWIRSSLSLSAIPGPAKRNGLPDSKRIG